MKTFTIFSLVMLLGGCTVLQPTQPIALKPHVTRGKSIHPAHTSPQTPETPETPQEPDDKLKGFEHSYVHTGYI